MTHLGGSQCGALVKFNKASVTGRRIFVSCGQSRCSLTHSWLRVRRLWRVPLGAVAAGQRTDPSTKSTEQCLQDCARHSLGREVKNPEGNNNKPGCCPCPCPQWCPVPFPDPKALHRGHTGQDSPLPSDPLPPGSFSIPAPWNAGRESAQI